VFLATVGADGEPIAHQPAVALHWPVGDSGNGVEVWGRASVHDELETKRRLWSGVFGYDLGTYAPGGPDGSPEIVFMAVEPRRALFMRSFGVGGQDTWRA
jgi:general stress protein 26